MMTNNDLPPITWIASYPKSGNTWMRYFLYIYLFGVPEKMSQVGVKAHSLENIFQEGRRADYFNPKNVDLIEELKKSVSKLQARAALSWPEDVKQFVLMKTHCKYTDDLPLLKSEDKIILIVRHPKDVLLSAVNYFQVLNRFESESVDNFVNSYIESLGVRQFTMQGYGSWSGHWKSWIQDASDKHEVLLVCYEDMLLDPAHVFSQVLNFLEIKPNPNRLEFALLNSKFDNLQGIEKKQKESKNHISDSDSQKYFFNKGESGRTIENVLGLKLDDKFDGAFQEFIDMFGMLANRGLVRVASRTPGIASIESNMFQLEKSVENGSRTYDLSDVEKRKVV